MTTAENLMRAARVIGSLGIPINIEPGCEDRLFKSFDRLGKFLYVYDDPNCPDTELMLKNIEFFFSSEGIDKFYRPVTFGEFATYVKNFKQAPSENEKGTEGERAAVDYLNKLYPSKQARFEMGMG